MADEPTTPNIGDDPINPAYYDGTLCAEIIEHLPGNLAIAVKYAWRLGEKDPASQEAGKALWYLRRETCRVPKRLVGDWFFEFSLVRIRAAATSGKLDLLRSEIIGECVMYAIHGEGRHVDRAIELFETYL